MASMLLIVFILAAILAVAFGTPTTSHIFREKAHLVGRPEIKPGAKSSADHHHTVVFGIAQRNVDKLEEVLLSVSDPRSAQYGKHWSRDEVGRFTENRQAVRELVNYLNQHYPGEAHIDHQSPYGEYITVSGRIHVWERFFATQFFEFRHADWSMSSIHRALEFSLPAELDAHIAGVFDVADFPVKRYNVVPFEEIPADTIQNSARMVDENPSKKKGKKDDKNNEDGDSASTSPLGGNGLLYANYVTPAFINNFYHVTNNTGSSLINQAVYSTIGQTFSPRDLTVFQKQFGLPLQGIAGSIGGFVKDTACKLSYNDCMEANLDVQYLTAVAQNIPTIHYYDNTTSWSSWIVRVSSMPNPPKLFSISYASMEPQVSSFTLNTFSTEAMKLGIQGVTILAASGDDGAIGFTTTTTAACMYSPSFPASNPYVTAVGGTQGPQAGTVEVASSTSTGGSITSGGGFSTFYARPSWQSTHVANYLTLATSQAATTPVAGYASTNRGFPDVSLIAQNYIIVGNNTLLGVAGTSASCPAFAGFVSLLNHLQVSSGKARLGFLNPLLYAYSASFTNDITSGDNKCGMSVCCSQGFYSLAGWDPVTGLGSVDFAKLATVVATSATSSPSAAPTGVPPASLPPTLAPTNVPTDAPTKIPTQVPTLPPSRSPTFSPTRPPTISPTTAPTRVPTLAPTRPPTRTPTTAPTRVPTLAPTRPPTRTPTTAPTRVPTLAPTRPPTRTPTTAPTRVPTLAPTRPPTRTPTTAPTRVPTLTPTRPPTRSPTVPPTRVPTNAPSFTPTRVPTVAPTLLVRRSLASTTLNPSNSFLEFAYENVTVFSVCLIVMFACAIFGIVSKFSVFSKNPVLEKPVAQI